MKNPNVQESAAWALCPCIENANVSSISTCLSVVVVCRIDKLSVNSEFMGSVHIYLHITMGTVRPVILDNTGQDRDGKMQDSKMY